MKQIQDSTVSVTRPSVASSGAFGWFKYDTTGTKVTPDWLNDVQGSFIDLFTRAGVTPVQGSAGDRNLYDAILALIPPAPFASGTKCLFAQASAPTGWTIVTDDTATNRALRVVNVNSGTGGLNGTGGGAWTGADDPTNIAAVPSHTHTFSDTGTTGTEGAHVHTFADTTSSTSASGNNHTHAISDVTNIASANHTHRYTDRFFVESASLGMGGSYIQVPTGGGTNSGMDNDNDTARYVLDDTAASGANHTHAFAGTTTTASSSHTHTVSVSGTTSAPTVAHAHSLTVSGTTATNGGAVNIKPRYLNLILCTKN